MLFRICILVCLGGNLILVPFDHDAMNKNEQYILEHSLRVKNSLLSPSILFLRQKG